VGTTEDAAADGPGSDQEQARRQAAAWWRAQGIDPYGARFETTHHSSQLRADFEALQGTVVAVAGRVVGLRRQGRVAFADLADRDGQIQLLLRPDALGAAEFDRILHCDLGDWLGVRGILLRTRSGEISVQPAAFTPLGKALRPMPDRRHGVRDADARYRRRYLDLMANPDSRLRFLQRSRLVSFVRRSLDGAGFIEVETPVLHGVASGAEARPFVTRHIALGMDLHLRIALELHLKRLLVGGLERVYEIGRVFRNEGLSTRHNPEFTMLECYQAFADYRDMMRLTEQLVAGAAMELHGGTEVSWRGRRIDLQPPWPRLSMVDALAGDGLDVLRAETDAAAREMAARAGVAVPEGATRAQVLDELVDHRLLPGLVAPTFLIDHPVEISPLARAKPDDPRLAERFELIIGGLELANAFSELNDPDEQRRRFDQQAAERDRGNGEAQQADPDFLRALEHGMPAAGGLGLGIDRLTMLLTDAGAIRDVILFPQLRPDEGL